MSGALGYEVHVSEVYNPERFKEECETVGMTFGQAFDLQVMKPEGGYWDFAQEADRDLCRAMLGETRPVLLIGSPMCRMFSNQMRLNRRHYSNEVWEKMMGDTRVHLEFVVSLYTAQHDEGRFWYHERPDKATS